MADNSANGNLVSLHRIQGVSLNKNKTRKLMQFYEVKGLDRMCVS